MNDYDGSSGRKTLPKYTYTYPAPVCDEDKHVWKPVRNQMSSDGYYSQDVCKICRTTRELREPGNTEIWYAKGELPGQSDKRVPCSNHPDAPHGFDRNGSHNNDRYTCYCEGFDEMMINSIISEIQSKIDENAGYWDDTEWKEQISYMKGLKER